MRSLKFSFATALFGAFLSVSGTLAQGLPSTPVADLTDGIGENAGFSPNTERLKGRSINDESPDGADFKTPLTEIPDELANDPKYMAEVEKQTQAFENASLRLREAIADQRGAHIRFLNEEANSKQDKEAFYAKRAEVRRLMDETYDAALDLTRIAPSADAAQYVLTMVQHRTRNGIYDAKTAEGAARLIDGGANYLFLYIGGARSAVVSGKFAMARQLYEAIEEEHLEKVDMGMVMMMDDTEKSWQREMELREQEAAADDLPRVKLITTQGDVVVELFLNEAPSTVANFIGLVEQGFYDGLDFHQVIPDLVALTGDPTGLGDGNSGKLLVDEFELGKSRDGFRGSLIMAKLPAPGGRGEFVPNSASSQFGILFTPTRVEFGEQTVFGRVIEGMDTTARLRHVDASKKKEKEIQLPPDRILEATVLRRPDELPEAQYFDLRAAIIAEQEQMRAAETEPATKSAGASDQ